MTGHLKHDNAMDRCGLQGATGDVLHTVLCAAALLHPLAAARDRAPGVQGHFFGYVPITCCRSNLSVGHSSRRSPWTHKQVFEHWLAQVGQLSPHRDPPPCGYCMNRPSRLLGKRTFRICRHARIAWCCRRNWPHGAGVEACGVTVAAPVGVPATP